MTLDALEAVLITWALVAVPVILLVLWIADAPYRREERRQRDLENHWATIRKMLG